MTTYELIFQMIFLFCSNDQACTEEINKCLDRKHWEYTDHSIYSDVPDQMVLDFYSECKEEVTKD